MGVYISSDADGKWENASGGRQAGEVDASHHVTRPPPREWVSHLIDGGCKLPQNRE